LPVNVVLDVAIWRMTCKLPLKALLEIPLNPPSLLFLPNPKKKAKMADHQQQAVELRHKLKAKHEAKELQHARQLLDEEEQQLMRIMNKEKETMNSLIQLNMFDKEECISTCVICKSKVKRNLGKKIQVNFTQKPCDECKDLERLALFCHSGAIMLAKEIKFPRFY